MKLDFDDDEELLKNTVRDFTRSELVPYLNQFDETPLPREAALKILQMVRPFGMLNARMPREAGGEDMSFVQLGILYDEFPAEVSLDTCTNDLVAYRMYYGGSDELRARYIEPLGQGTMIAGSAISEPDAGSDLSSIATKAVLDGDEYVVNGTKLWSSQSSIADVLLVAVSRGSDVRGRSEVARLVVDTEDSSEGLSMRDLEMLGLKKHHMSEIFFENCRVPAAHMVGEAGDGIRALNQSWLSQRANLGLIAIHIAQEALDESLKYAMQRTQFGHAIGSFQLVQEMLVEMTTLVDTGRFLCYRTLYLLDQGKNEEAKFASSVAKYYATEAAVKVTSMAVQIHGAMGLSCEHTIEKLFRDARMLTIPDGTTQVQKLLAGRELTGMNALRH